MDWAFLAGRIIHIGLGVFWAGTLIFNAAFLLPAMAEAGLSGAAVAAGLTRRRFLDVMPIAAGLTVVSGFFLYWRVSAGFSPAFMRSPMGMAYGVGAASALAAFLLGVGVMRPAMLRAAALVRHAAEAPEAERGIGLAEAQALRTRAAGGGRWVAWLLGAATVAMALARYV